MVTPRVTHYYCHKNFTFDPRKHVLGIYLQSIGENCAENLVQQCNEQKLSFSAYYRAIYSAYCNIERYEQVKVLDMSGYLVVEPNQNHSRNDENTP